MGIYQILGRPGAGSLIGEFLLTDVGQKYQFVLVSQDYTKSGEYLKVQPFGKIPVLICPDGRKIFETTAITAHLIEKFSDLAPSIGDVRRDLNWQYIAISATAIYDSYLRFNYPEKFAPEAAAKEVSLIAAQERDVVYDYIETILDPYLLGSRPYSADFYLYMVTGWWSEQYQTILSSRPKLKNFVKMMESNPTVETVIGFHSNS